MTILLLSAIIAMFALAIAVVPAFVILRQAARQEAARGATVTRLGTTRASGMAHAA